LLGVVVQQWKKTMKSAQTIFATIILAALFLSNFAVTAEASKVTLEYFYIPPSKFGYCPTCYDPAIDNIIQNITTKYNASQVFVDRIDVTTTIGGERFNNYSLTGIPTVVITYQSQPPIKVPKENITFLYLDSIISQYLGGSVVNPPPNNEDSVGITLPLVIVSAFVDGINPCAFALLVFFLSYLFSIQQSRGKILAMGSTYIIGLFVTYFLIGFGILRSVSFFGIEHFFGLVGVVLMIALGVVAIADYMAPGRFSIRFPSKAVPTFKSTVQKATIPAALLLGGFVGLCEFPCTGAIYGGVLAYLSTQTTYFSGVIYLILYNLIFVLPLIVLLLFASNARRLTKIDAWRHERRRQIKLFSGVLMIILGLLVFYWLMM